MKSFIKADPISGGCISTRGLILLQILWSNANREGAFAASFSLQPFSGKIYHEGLNRLLTDSNKFEKSENYREWARKSWSRREIGELEVGNGEKGRGKSPVGN
jgi:hypothetical protein